LISIYGGVNLGAQRSNRTRINTEKTDKNRSELLFIREYLFIRQIRVPMNFRLPAALQASTPALPG
jgi:hypothetical protein